MSQPATEQPALTPREIAHEASLTATARMEVRIAQQAANSLLHNYRLSDPAYDELRQIARQLIAAAERADEQLSDAFRAIYRPNDD